MPTYEYKCNTCGHTFEAIRTISRRNEPESEPCPECGVGEVRQKIGVTSIGDAIRMGIKKPDAGFNEVLRNIKKAHPGSTMNIRD